MQYWHNTDLKSLPAAAAEILSPSAWGPRGSSRLYNGHLIIFIISIVIVVNTIIIIIIIIIIRCASRRRRRRRVACPPTPKQSSRRGGRAPPGPPGSFRRVGRRWRWRRWRGGEPEQAGRNDRCHSQRLSVTRKYIHLTKLFPDTHNKRATLGWYMSHIQRVYFRDRSQAWYVTLWTTYRANFKLSIPAGYSSLFGQIGFPLDINNTV